MSLFAARSIAASTARATAGSAMATTSAGERSARGPGPEHSMIGRAHDNVLSQRFAFVRGTTRQGGTNATKGVVIAILVAACSSPAAPVVTAPPIPVITAPTETLYLGGTGVITFGLEYDEDTLEIVREQASFRTGNKGIAWSASLDEAADATTLTWILAKVSSGGAESILYKEDTDISNPDFDILANKVDLALLVDRKPGTYVMRYLRDADVLAEGTFKLTK